MGPPDELREGVSPTRPSRRAVRFREAAFVAVFALLAAVMTYPLVFMADSGVPLEPNGQPRSDPLLSIWILGWGAHALVADPAHLFNGNILYPRTRTLAYADHLLGGMLFSGPVFWLTGNAVFAHNVLLFATFVLCGYGMFCLARHLTGSLPAALAAGVIYAFCPMRFAQYDRVHVLSSHWMPFALLFLHRFLAGGVRNGECGMRRGSLQNLALAFLFTFLQSISCTYYALFFATFLPLFLLATWAMGAWPRAQTRQAVALFIVFFLALAATVYPFVRPYAKLREEMGYRREIAECVKFSADVRSYLATPSESVLYGAMLGGRAQAETTLFPGLIATALALVGILPTVHKRAAAKTVLVYLAWALCAFLLSFGPYFKLGGQAAVAGPYYLLYRFAPGYDALRVPARFATLLMLALAVLAAWGLKGLLEQLTRPVARHALAVAVLAILILEYLAMPLPLGALPTGDAIPEVYKWLAQQKEDIRLVEVPSDLHLTDLMAMHYSTYHWKKIVNGESGSSPPEDYARFMLFADFPNRPSVQVLRAIGVTHVLWHQPQLVPERMRRLQELPELRPLRAFGEDYVFEVQGGGPEPARPRGPEIAGTGWKAAASHHSAAAALALDGRPDTAWQGRVPQQGDDWFQLDLGRPETVASLALSFGPRAACYPRYLMVEASADGQHWEIVFHRAHWPDLYASLYLSCLQSPRNPTAAIHFSRPVQCRHLRLSLATGPTLTHPWAMAEVRLFADSNPQPSAKETDVISRPVASSLAS